MQTRNLIGDRWVPSESGEELAVNDPATDEIVARVPLGGAREARAAVSAAAAAFGSWSRRPARQRAALLSRLAELMLERQASLSQLMTLEQGKPLSEASGEIGYAASFIEWAAEEAKRVEGEIVPASREHQRILVLRQPVGVTAAITPWNFPAAMIARKLGPALAAGCTMVVKPAEQTPLSALALGELALEAGIPPGVVNVITGDAASIGAELLGNPSVRKLSFTGSTEVGRLLVRGSADNLTRLSLELGGHAPFIVFDDADVDAAVKGAVASKFRNAGQTCISANRFLVQAGVYDAFVSGLCEACRELKLGSGLEPGVSIGPLIDDAAVAKVESHVADATRRGARLTLGGRRQRPAPQLTDRFFEPTVLEGVNESMLASSEETFGPVAPVRRFDSEREAIALANQSPYGLAAYFYTRDASRLMRVAEQLDCGIVGANDGAPSTAQAPFGGIKHSGYGREGGRYAMHEYLNVKYVSWGL